MISNKYKIFYNKKSINLIFTWTSHQIKNSIVVSLGDKEKNQRMSNSYKNQHKKYSDSYLLHSSKYWQDLNSISPYRRQRQMYRNRDSNGLSQQTKEKSFNQHLPWSKDRQKSGISPQAQIRHKGHQSALQHKALHHSMYPKQQEDSPSFVYPYTYTEYDMLKQKMKQKQYVEERWLQSQISRLKKQDQNLNKKNKSNYHRSFNPSLQIQKKKSVRDLVGVNKQDYEAFSNNINFRDQGIKKDGLQKTVNRKLFRKDYKNFVGQESLKESNQSQTVGQKAVQAQAQQNLGSGLQPKKLMKPQIHMMYLADRNKYLQDKSAVMREHQSKLRAQHGERYTYLDKQQKMAEGQRNSQNNKVTEAMMINKARALHEFNECYSNYEQQVDQSKNRQQIMALFNEKKTIQKSLAKSKSLAENNSLYSRQLSDIEHQRRYLQFFDRIQQREGNEQPHKSKTYGKYLVFNSECCKQPNNSSINEEYKNSEQTVKQIHLSNSQTNQQMGSYKSDQQANPIFSSFSLHKQLPLSTDNYLSWSNGGKKATQDIRAFQQKMQVRLKSQGNVNPFIVERVEKRNVLSRKHQDGLEASQHEQFHLKTGQINHQPNRQMNQINDKNLQNEESAGKTLKVELDIVKQQLQQKNRKVVNLQLELMQLRNSQPYKQQQDEKPQTSNHLEQQNQPHIVDQISKSQQCQTQPPRQSIRLLHSTVSQVIQPDRQLQMRRSLQYDRTNQLVQKLRYKLSIRQQAMTNFLGDIQMYQRENQGLKVKIRELQSGTNKTNQ